MFFFLVLYLLFPVGFSTTDGWNYAAEIKHTGTLFYPYHLLYNAFGYLFCYFPSRAGADILGSLKAMNAIFAVMAIFMVQLIIRKLGKERITVVTVSCLTGTSFSVMRYATENETYILPLFLSLAATYYFLCFLNSGKGSDAFLTGVLSSVSVLFHISYICWWIGLLAGILFIRNRRPSVLFLLSSLIIPIIYLAVILAISGNLHLDKIAGFIFGDFIKNSSFKITGKGLLLSVINFIRSFIQVHGYMLNMFKYSLLLVLPAVISILLLIKAFFIFPEKGKDNPTFAFVIAVIALLNMILAVLSSGNAEFMVMIPVLIFILFPVFFKNPGKFFLNVFAAILIWNISYGIVPLSINLHGTEEYLAGIAASGKETMIIASDDQRLSSMVYYNTGKRDNRTILISPAVMKNRGFDQTILRNSIDSALANGIPVYTDCMGPRIISRASILQGSENSLFFSNYDSEIVMTETLMTGTKMVSQIKSRKYK